MKKNLAKLYEVPLEFEVEVETEDKETQTKVCDI